MLAIAEQALAVLRANAGDESAEVGSALARIAGLHADLGDYARSRDLAGQAVAIQERVLPPDSRVLASTLGQLARSYYSLGELAEARVALERQRGGTTEADSLDARLRQLEAEAAAPS